MKLGPFLGISNRRPDFDLHIKMNTTQGDYLRDAINVDIDNTGRLLRRKVPTLVQAMTGAHSLYMTDETNGLLVIDSILYAITLPSYTQTLLKVLNSNAAMSYVEQGGEVFYSNGTDSGRIVSGAFYPLALPTPDTPTISSIGGNLLAGWYQVAVSYARYSGATQTAATLLEEGGVCASANIELTSTGGIRVPLPAATAGATHINVYLSAANGEVPYLATVVPTGTALVDLIALSSGRGAAPRYEEPLPAGRLFMSSGRLCSYKGKTLYVGIPYRPGYYEPAEGYVPFATDISVVVDAQDGLFVAADKTYWLPNEGVIADVLPYGAVPGTGFSYSDKSIYGWFGEKGFVLGKPSGEVEAAMSDNILLTPPTNGFCTIFEDDEFRRVTGCGWTMNLANNAVTRYEDWNFTSFSRGYGTQADGIYSLATGGDVAWNVDFGKVNLGNDQIKHMPNVYLGVESSDVMQLVVNESYTYPARSFDEALKNQRIDVGKGLRAPWFHLQLTGTEGADFRLSYVDFVPATTRRRI